MYHQMGDSFSTAIAGPAGALVGGVVGSIVSGRHFTVPKSLQQGFEAIILSGHPELVQDVARNSYGIHWYENGLPGFKSPARMTKYGNGVAGEVNEATTAAKQVLAAYGYGLTGGPSGGTVKAQTVTDPLTGAVTSLPAPTLGPGALVPAQASILPAGVSPAVAIGAALAAVFLFPKMLGPARRARGRRR
jgi:hypothetical protein